MANLHQANWVKRLFRDSYREVTWFRSVKVALGDDGYYVRLHVSKDAPKNTDSEWVFCGVRIETIYE